MVHQITIARTGNTPQTNVGRTERVIYTQWAIRNMPIVRIYKAVCTTKNVMQYPLLSRHLLQNLLH